MMRRIDYVWSFFCAFQIVAFTCLLMVYGKDNIATWIYTACGFASFAFILVLDRFHYLEEPVTKQEM